MARIFGEFLVVSISQETKHDKPPNPARGGTLGGVVFNGFGGFSLHPQRP